MVRKNKSRSISTEIDSDNSNVSDKVNATTKDSLTHNGEVETMVTDEGTQKEHINGENDMDIDVPGTGPAVADQEEDVEGDADLSLCDASFSAAESVPTSGHTRVSRCTEGVEQFLEALREHGDRGTDFDFEESLGILTLEEMSALWVSLNQYTTTSMLSLVGGVDGDSDQALEVVSGVVLLAKFCTPLPLVQGDRCPPALIQTAILLHSVIPSLQDNKLTNNICLLLESWYTLELPDKDSLTTNCLVSLLYHLLSRC